MSESKKEVAQIGFSPKEEPPYGYTREDEVYEVPNEIPVERASSPPAILARVFTGVILGLLLLFYGLPRLIPDEVLDDYLKLEAEHRAENAYYDMSSACLTGNRYEYARRSVEFQSALRSLPYDNPTHQYLSVLRMNHSLLGYC